MPGVGYQGNNLNWQIENAYLHADDCSINAAGVAQTHPLSTTQRGAGIIATPWDLHVRDDLLRLTLDPISLATGVHDDPCQLNVMREGLTAYANPGTLPADVSADGDDVRATGSRKGETYNYPSRLNAGEDLTNKVQVTEGRWNLGSGGILAATGTLHNAACRLACIVLSETGGVNPVTAVVRDGGGGGVQIMPTIYCAAGQNREVLFNLPIATDVHVTIAGAGTASVAAYRHVGGP